ncbi:unnamed protein product [Larinioides sclopetarius]|uniref:Uncharacterized protein n=1 Tax=Larinioides sclopetarius TaxID=280406 RepID=A0AAV2A1V2_9ARAC
MNLSCLNFFVVFMILIVFLSLPSVGSLPDLLKGPMDMMNKLLSGK